jgi:hypothetical protein
MKKEIEKEKKDTKWDWEDKENPFLCGGKI